MQKVLPVVFFAIASSRMAQSETGHAALEGTISDASGKTVGFAKIVLHETQTGL